MILGAQSPVHFIPEQASTVASRVDALYYYLVGVTAFFSIGIAGLIFYFAIRYRRRSPEELPPAITGSLRLEMVWTVVPFIIAMSMFVWGASVYFAQYHVPNNALDIYVVAKQWMWKFQHTGGQREINELHVPLGRKIKLTMATEDVIHSFYVPAFRVKNDVVPGRYSTLWFEATQRGRYHLFCAEYCGTSHSGMIGWIVVMDPTEYQDWLSGGTAMVSMASAGQKVFTDLQCDTCHSSTSGGMGPALEGVFGSTRRLQDARTAVADESYLRESILNPEAKMVEGYPPIMPAFQGQVSQEQLLQLIAYIKSIGPEQKPAPGRAK